MSIIRWVPVLLIATRLLRIQSKQSPQDHVFVHRRRVGLGRRGDADEAAEVVEVGLGGGALGQGVAAPDRLELLDVHTT